MTVSRLDALICEQEGLERLDRESLRSLQLEKLNALLARERKRGGFYRGLPERLDSLDALSELPFTTQADLSENPGAFLLCSQSEVHRVITEATSGTTGRPKRVFYTRSDCENTVRLYMAGLGELVFPGGVCLIAFPFSGPFGLGELIAETIERLGARPLKAGPFLSYGEYRRLLENERPDCFVGMPVQLLSILRVCGRGSLRRALVSGDACPASVARRCEDILGSRLFPHYGSREMGMAGAISCPAHEGMHLRENHVLAEIVDENGRVLPPGEFGELVVTTLGMEAMPLIRYRSGDRARILSEPCPCGSATLRLDGIARLHADSLPAQIDETVFSLPDAVDCRSRVGEGGVLELEVLAAGRPDEAALRDVLGAAFPDRRFALRLRTVGPDDRALQPGKRGFVR